MKILFLFTLSFFTLFYFTFSLQEIEPITPNKNINCDIGQSKLYFFNATKATALKFVHQYYIEETYFYVKRGNVPNVNEFDHMKHVTGQNGYSHFHLPSSNEIYYFMVYCKTSNNRCSYKFEINYPTITDVTSEKISLTAFAYGYFLRAKTTQKVILESHSCIQKNAQVYTIQDWPLYIDISDYKNYALTEASYPVDSSSGYAHIVSHRSHRMNEHHRMNEDGDKEGDKDDDKDADIDDGEDDEMYIIILPTSSCTFNVYYSNELPPMKITTSLKGKITPYHINEYYYDASLNYKATEITENVDWVIRYKDNIGHQFEQRLSGPGIYPIKKFNGNVYISVSTKFGPQIYSISIKSIVVYTTFSSNLPVSSTNPAFLSITESKETSLSVTIENMSGQQQFEIFYGNHYIPTPYQYDQTISGTKKVKFKENYSTVGTKYLAIYSIDCIASCSFKVTYGESSSVNIGEILGGIFGGGSLILLIICFVGGILSSFITSCKSKKKKKIEPLHQPLLIQTTREEPTIVDSLVQPPVLTSPIQGVHTIKFHLTTNPVTPVTHEFMQEPIQEPIQESMQDSIQESIQESMNYPIPPMAPNVPSAPIAPNAPTMDSPPICSDMYYHNKY